MMSFNHHHHFYSRVQSVLNNVRNLHVIQQILHGAKEELPVNHPGIQVMLKLRMSIPLLQD